MMQIITMVSDPHLNCLKPFSFLFNKYFDYNQPVTVCGYTPPSFPLPENFTFVSIGDFKDYPFDRWSDGLIEVLNWIADPIFCLMFEDYWLNRPVDVRGVYRIYHYMLEHENIIRFDLTNDRLYANGIKHAGSLEHYDLLESNPSIPYHFSYQAGLWQRDLLKEIVKPNESAGTSENMGNTRLAQHPEWRVLGTRQSPMNYLIGVQGAQPILTGSGYQDESHALGAEDIMELNNLHYLENL